MTGRVAVKDHLQVLAGSKNSISIHLFITSPMPRNVQIMSKKERRKGTVWLSRNLVREVKGAATTPLRAVYQNNAKSEQQGPGEGPRLLPGRKSPWYSQLGILEV